MSQHTRSASTALHPHFVLLGLATLVLLIVLAGCGRPYPTTAVLQNQPSPTAAPTYTPNPSPSQKWQTGKLPAPVVNLPGASAIAISQLDSSLAWECVPDGNRVAIWVTHTRAATWSHTATVFVRSQVDSCAVVLDGMKSGTAVVMTYHEQNNEGCMACFNGIYLSFLTTDNGASWTPLHGPDDMIAELATYHGKLYATFRPHPVDLAAFTAKFVVSGDGFRSWQPVDSALTVKASDPIESRSVLGFWINPATGAMLAETQTSVVWSNHFDASGDGGASWQDLQAPAADDYLVRAPFAAGQWQICGLRTSSSSAHPSWSNTIICTLDGGASWQTRTITPVFGAFAIANDGSVLAALSQAKMLRLLPGKGDWQPFGFLDAPNTTLSYSAGSGKGVIWAIPSWDSGAPTPTSPVVYTVSYG